MVTCARFLFAAATAIALTGCFHVHLNGPVTEAQVVISSLRGGEEIERLTTPTIEQSRQEFGEAEWDAENRNFQLMYSGNITPTSSLYDPDALYLVTVIGGDDNDADNDRDFDTNPARSYGRFYGIYTGEQLSKRFSIGALTDAMYRSLQPRLDSLSDAEVLAELDALSSAAVEDIDSNGAVNYIDALRWARHLNPGFLRGSLDDYDALAAAIRNNEPEAELRAKAESLLGSAPEDNTPPSTVVIETPPSGTTYTSAGPVTINVFAQDDVGVTRVEFLKNGRRIALDTTAPWSITRQISAASNGSFELTARAFDAVGNATTSEPVAMTINIPSGGGDNVAGGIWEFDSDSLSVRGYEDFQITFDEDNNVIEVSYVLDGVPRIYGAAEIERSDLDVEADDSVELEIDWGGGSNLDFAGFLTASRDAVHGPLVFTIREGSSVDDGFTTATLVEQASGGGGSDSEAPAVDITNPVSGTVYTTATDVTITASASDNVGVTHVEFFSNNVLKWQDTRAPFQYQKQLTAASNGSYTLTARAYDAAGNVTTSDGVNVTIDIPAGGGTPPSGGTWLLSSFGLASSGIQDFLMTFDENFNIVHLSYTLYGSRREFGSSQIDRDGSDVRGNSVGFEFEWARGDNTLEFEGTLDGSRNVATGTIVYWLQEGWDVQAGASSATLTRQ